MPLVAHSHLPSFHRLHQEGADVLSLERARNQDIRELHIGLLNIMPDSALEATERQFLRLIDASSGIVQFYVHPFTLKSISRDAKTQAHIDAHYASFPSLAEAGLDAMIITGANVPGGDITEEAFWPEFQSVFNYCNEYITSTLCACLASHAAFQHLYGIERVLLPRKRWGVFEHRRRLIRHPLVRAVNTRFDVPHSRYNDISAASMQQANVKILAESADAGVHLAVSPNLLRFVFFQGHPEYDRESLLKEYRREMFAYLNGERAQCPPPPRNYLNPVGERIAAAYEETLMGSAGVQEKQAAFPQDALLENVDNTWGDSARTVFSQWLGLVYQLTGFDRHMPAMPGRDPADPLELRRAFESAAI